MPVASDRVLPTFLLMYVAASLGHFTHNAESLMYYPNLPDSWSRAGVYLAWIAVTLVGFAGWIMVARGYQRAGLLVLVTYALLGVDSLGHYIVAPFSAHTFAMNATIIFEAATAFLVLMVATSRLCRAVHDCGSPRWRQTLR